MTPSKIIDVIDQLTSNDIPSETLSSCTSEIAKELADGSSTLVSIIERLGPTLTNLDVGVRIRGVRLLTNLLTTLSPTILDSRQTHFIGQFYCDRLKDHHSVIPHVLQGILSLSHQKNLQEDMVLKIIHEIFQNLSCQTQNNEDRYTIYQIFHQFIENYLEQLKKLGPDFIYGLISSVDGERNPKNLHFLFKILPNFFKKYPLGHLTEEVFDIVACYYPIDFNPAFNKTPSITRESLAEGLADCLTACPDFAEYCYNLLNDKMSSTLKTAILDSFDVLKLSASRFPINLFESHLEEIWNYLREALFPGNDVELREAALSTTTTLIINYPESQLLDYIVESCRAPLSRVDLSLFQPAIRVLGKISSATPRACSRLLIECLPPLAIELEKYTNELDRRTTILNASSILLESAAMHGLGGPWPKIVPAMVSESAISDAAWRPLSACAKILDNEQRQEVYKSLKSRVGVCKEANTCLEAFTKIHPNEVLNNLIIPMVNEIQLEDDNNTERYISAVILVASEEPFTSTVIPAILQTALSRKFNIPALHSLTWLASQSSSNNCMKYLNIKCDALAKFVAHNKEDTSFEIIQATAKLLDLIVAAQSEDIQQHIVEEYTEKFLNEENNISIFIFEAIINSMSRSIKIPQASLLLLKLMNSALNSNDPLTCTSYSRLIATLINKSCEFETISMLSRLQEIFNDNSSDHKSNAIEILSWTCKGLLARGAPEAADWLDAMHSLLLEEDWANKAANGFKILVDDTQRCLSLENKCQVKLFYRQRAFEKSVQRLTGDRSTNAHLLSLAYLMKGVSISVLVTYFDKLLKSMVRALDQNDEPLIIIPFLESLQGLLKTQVPTIESHLSTFIPRCLNLSKFKNSMKVRIIALECLELMTKYPPPSLLSFRNQVLTGLAPALDDPKRLVRRQAVTTRSLWFLVGAVEEPS